jgi:hypothetical protein
LLKWKSELEHAKQQLAQRAPAVAACSQEASRDLVSWPRSVPELISHSRLPLEQPVLRQATTEPVRGRFPLLFARRQLAREQGWLPR